MESSVRGQRTGENLELSRILSKSEWTNIFRKYDYDNDDKIPIRDFIRELRDGTDDYVPILTIEQALRAADRDGDRIITLQEFLDLVKYSNEGRSKAGKIFLQYVYWTVPLRNRVRRRNTDTSIDGEYEDEYKLWPPPVGMILVSLLETALFLYDTFKNGYGRYDGPLSSMFIYNPCHREEVWRFFTYMFVHSGAQHLLVNLAVQIMLGVPLEMVHGWWRIIIIYLNGVFAGSLFTSVTDPNVYLAGASGGVYSIITAHIATIILNWSEMELALVQLIIILIVCGMDTGSAVYNRYFLNGPQNIGYEAHFAGAIAGLLVGIHVLRNLEVRSWEKKLWWASLFIYTLLIITGIIINIAFPEYFPCFNLKLK